MVDSGSGGMGDGMSPSGVTDVPPLSCEAPITVLSLRGGRSRLLVWVAASLLVALMAAVGLSVRRKLSSRFVAQCHAPAFADSCRQLLSSCLDGLSEPNERDGDGWRRGLSCLLFIQATQGKDGRLIMLEQILPFENL